MANEDLRNLAKENSVKLWEIAEKMHMADSNFSRLLRHELPPEKKQRAIDYIDEIVREKKTAI